MPNVREWCLRNALKITTKAEFIAEVAQIWDDLDVSSLSYMDIGLSGISSYATTYSKAWQRQYLDRDLIAWDPVVRVSRTVKTMALWPTPSADRFEADARFYDLAGSFNVPICGMVANLPVVGGRVVVSLGSRLPPLDWQRVFESRSADLYLFAATCGHCLKRLDAADTKSLSPRERDVLLWAARGKTSWETACILGLREGTVNYYVRGAIRKMEASSKVHCIVLAMEAGQLDVDMNLGRVQRSGA